MFTKSPTPRQAGCPYPGGSNGRSVERDDGVGEAEAPPLRQAKKRASSSCKALGPAFGGERRSLLLPKAFRKARTAMTDSGRGAIAGEGREVELTQAPA